MSCSVESITNLFWKQEGYFSFKIVAQTTGLVGLAFSYVDLPLDGLVAGVTDTGEVYLEDLVLDVTGKLTNQIFPYINLLILRGVHDTVQLWSIFLQFTVCGSAHKRNCNFDCKFVARSAREVFIQEKRSASENLRNASCNLFLYAQLYLFPSILFI